MTAFFGVCKLSRTHLVFWSSWNWFFSYLTVRDSYSVLFFLVRVLSFIWALCMGVRNILIILSYYENVLFYFWDKSLHLTNIPAAKIKLNVDLVTQAKLSNLFVKRNPAFQLASPAATFCCVYYSCRFLTACHHPLSLLNYLFIIHVKSRG